MAALTPADLAPVDEFHIGSRPATVHFADSIGFAAGARLLDIGCGIGGASRYFARSEEHTSELQSLMRISYAVFCLKKKKQHNRYTTNNYNCTNRIYTSR